MPTERKAEATAAIVKYFPGAQCQGPWCLTTLGRIGIIFSHVTQQWLAKGVLECYGMPKGFDTADDAAHWLADRVDKHIAALQKERGIVPT
jgi:hypothetical protein